MATDKYPIEEGFADASKMNAVFQKELGAMPPETRDKILALEKAGLYGKGKDYEKNRYPEDYMKTAWGEGYFPYLYQTTPIRIMIPWRTVKFLGTYIE